MVKYGKAAEKTVEAAMKEMKAGRLKSGGTGKKVTIRKQAVAIGLSEARRAGAKMPTQRASASKRVGSSARAAPR